MPAQLLIQHNTFSWESADYVNDYGNRPQVSAIHVKEFPGLQSQNLVIKDNIFFGYQTIEKDDGFKKAPLINKTGKYGGAIEFDGDDDFATFIHPQFDFGSKGTLSMWAYLYNINKRNTLLLGPQGENLAAANTRNANDKSFEFQVNDRGAAFFYPNYSDHVGGGDALVMADTLVTIPEEWYHIAFTWDKDANGGEGHIYLNGFEVDYKISSANPPAYRYDSALGDEWINSAITTNGLFYLGRDPNDANAADPNLNRMLYGRIDELILFNEAIDFQAVENHKIRQAQFKDNMAEYADKLIAYWPFDNISGYELLDETGNIELKLGRGWPGFALLVPEAASVNNNLFFQNTVHSTVALADDNIFADPIFMQSAGGVLKRYALQDGSPAANAATDGISNIGARQPSTQSITFEIDERFNGKRYGDTVDLTASSDANLPVTFEIDQASSAGSGTFNGNTLTITGAGKIVLRAVQAGNANYFPATSAPISFTALKAVLTVTADDAKRGTTDPNPQFTLSYDGFVGSDTPVVLDTPPTATTTATPASSAGTYDIIPAGGVDNNYDFTYINGTLEINTLLQQTITFADVDDLTYGEEVTLTASTDSGLPVTFAVRGGQRTGPGEVLSGQCIATKVGEVTIRATAAGDATYNPATPVDKTFSVFKRPLTVTALNTDRPYGDAYPDFSWLVSEGDTLAAGETNSAGIAVGRTGDLYWAGTFDGRIQFGGLAYQSVGSPDMFLARYQEDGTLEWFRHAGIGVEGGNGAIFPVSVDTDTNNNVYIIGTFQGIVTLGNRTMTSVSEKDVFLLKYSETGNFVWVAQASGAGPGDEAVAVAAAVDSVGTTYVVGEFKGSISFEGTTALQSEPANNPGVDIFLARFNVNGRADWVKQIGGPNEDMAGGIALDTEGQPVVTGSFSGFGILDASTTITATGASEMFVAKYDTTGELLWSKQAGGANLTSLQVNGVATGPNGASVVSATFEGEIEVQDMAYPSAGLKDALFIMYDSYGDVVWAESLGGLGDDTGLSAAIGDNRTALLNGTFTDTLTLGTADSQVLNAKDQLEDIFIVKIDSSGKQKWGRQSFGAGAVPGLQMGVDAEGSAYLAGSFSGGIEAGNLSATALGSRDAFLTQLNRDIPKLPLAFEGFITGRDPILGPEDESFLDELPVATVPDTRGSDAGSKFPITISGGSDDNYVFTFVPGVLTIVKAEQSINFFQDLTGVQYQDIVPLTAVATSGLDVTYTILTGKDIVYMPDDKTLVIESVGPVRIKASQPGNHNFHPAFSVFRDIDVAKAPQEIEWLQDFAGKTYGDTVKLSGTTTSGLTLTYNVKEGEALIEDGKVTFTKAGTVTLQATQQGTFVFEAAEPMDKTFQVAKAKLTVQPNDDIRTTGDPDPEFVLNYSGFKLLDDVTDIDVLPVAYTDTGAATPEGEYPILIMGGSDDNYSFEFVPANMIITDLLVQRIFFDQDFSGWDYGETHEFTAFSDAGLLVTYTLEVGDATLNGSSITFHEAGEMVVTAHQVGNDNYAAAIPVQRTIEVGKLVLQVIADSQQRNQGDPNLPLTWQAKGFFGSDSDAGIDAPPNISTSATEFSLPGDYPIVLDGGFDNNYRFEFTEGLLTVLDPDKALQAISWDQDLSGLQFGDEVTLTAASDSGLPISYKVINGRDVIQVQGDKLMVIGAGDITIEASQPGNSQYNPALKVTRQFQVGEVAQLITWDQSIGFLEYGKQIFLEATSASGLPVSYTAVSGDAIIDFNLLIPLQVGPLVIRAVQTGNDVFQAADPVERTFVVQKAPLRVTAVDVVRKVGVANPVFQVIYDGFRLGDTSAILDVAPVAYTDAFPSSPPGVYSILFNPGESDKYRFAAYTPATLTIVGPGKTDQSITWNLDPTGIGTGDFFQLRATASSGLPVSYETLAGADKFQWSKENEILIKSPGQITIMATQAGDDLYNPANPVAQNLVIPMASQAILWDQDIDDPRYGDTVQMGAASSSGLQVRYILKSGQANIEGDEITFTSAGTVVVEVIQKGDTFYEEATPVEREFLVGKAELTAWPLDVRRFQGDTNPRLTIEYDGFKFGDDETVLLQLPQARTQATEDSPLGSYPIILSGGLAANYTFNLLDGALHVVDTGKRDQWVFFDQNLYGFRPGDFVRLTARSSSGLQVTYDLDEGHQLVRFHEADVIEFLAAGHFLIKAQQPGDDEYYPAPTEYRSIEVVGREQQILWDQDFSDVVYGDTVGLVAYATSGQPVQFKLLQGEATVDGDNLTFTSAGQDVIIQATQPGDNHFAAAQPVIRTFLVNKAPLEVVARDLVWNPGKSRPKLVYDLEGFLFSDKASVLLFDPAIKTTAEDSSPSGLYPITVSGGFADNYDFVYRHGVMLKRDAAKTDQSIVWNQTFSNVFPGTRLDLTATATSGLPVSYEISSGEGLATFVSSNAIRIDGTGTIIIRAYQSGSNSFNPAQISREIVLSKQAQGIIWTQKFTNVKYGDSIELTAEATSGLPVEYVVTAGEVSFQDDVITVLSPGTVSLLAKQAGDTTWLPASPVAVSFVAGKAKLTAIADGKQSLVGQPFPQFTVGYQGFVLGDTAAAIDVPPTAYTTADESSPAGVYDILLNVGYSELYDLKYQQGFHILSAKNQQPQTIIWNQTFADALYGDIVALEAVNENFAGHLEYRVIGGEAEVTKDGVNLELPGAGDVAVAVFADARGNLNAAPPIVKVIEVGQRPLVVQVKDAFRLYNTPNPPFQIEYENLAPWDQDEHISIVLKQVPYTYTHATQFSPEGVYPILVEGGKDPNYLLRYGSALLTIRDWAHLWDPYPVEEDGMKTVPWFGRIYDYPGTHWIWHETHGFLYGLGFSEESIWFWDEVMGWVWTGKNAYPWMYRAGPGIWYEEISGTFSPRWYYYGIGTTNSRWFYDATLGRWTTLIQDDNDGDGMADAWEIDHFGTTDVDGTKDTDQDGLSDLLEYRNRLDPRHPDSDRDGFTDSWEVANGYDPLDPTSPSTQ